MFTPTTLSLYINDYNLDSVNAKLNGLIALVNRVNQATPGTIDGIGTQGHLQGGQGSSAQAALTAMANANVKEVAITELDIAGAPAADYTAVVRACLNTPKCVGITVWGVSDTVSDMSFSTLCELTSLAIELLEVQHQPPPLRWKLQTEGCVHVRDRNPLSVTTVGVFDPHREQMPTTPQCTLYPSMKYII